MKKYKKYAWIMALVVGLVLGYGLRSIPPTEFRYIYVAPNERIVVDNKLYPMVNETYRNNDPQHPCRVEIYNGNLGTLPEELRELLPTFCELRNVSIWFAEDGTVFVKMRLKTGYPNGDDVMQNWANILHNRLLEESLFLSYSFEGYQAPDSITFVSETLEEAYFASYGADSPERPQWYVDSIWFAVDVE